MDRMLYIATSGGTNILRAQTLVTNNLANANTNGFRADLARFNDSPIQGPGYASRVNSISQGLGFNKSPGAMVSTGRELDVAIRGPGWIAVQAPDGTEAYTRGGSLFVNSLGLLETRSGLLVQGDNGPVAVPTHVQLMVGSDGVISVIPEGQGPETLAEVGRVKLVNPDPATMLKRHDGLVQLVDGATAEPDANVQIVSGFLESSNVNLAESMVSLIELARQFEIQMKMMQTADDNANRAAQIIRAG